MIPMINMIFESNSKFSIFLYIIMLGLLESLISSNNWSIYSNVFKCIKSLDTNNLLYIIIIEFILFLASSNPVINSSLVVIDSCIANRLDIVDILFFIL